MTAHEQEIASFGSNEEFWLFGYGSLIWKPPPHYDQRVPGYITGYVRRFWQASEDHRGTPEAPGRVVTLIERKFWETLGDISTAPSHVYGAAYHIPKQYIASVRSYLDLREINGYSIQFTPFNPTNSSSSKSPSTTPSKSIRCLVYIGLPNNPQFLGYQDQSALARHILQSKGPSGENKEYLYNLHEALEGLGEESGDEHVSGLMRLCREIEEARNVIAVAHVDANERGDANGNPIHHHGGTEGLEEVEK